MLGLETTVSIGKQSSAAKPSTLPRQALNVYAISGGQTEDDTDDEILGGSLNNTEDPTEPGPGLDDHRVRVQVPICVAQFGYWLAAYMGTELTPTGTTPNYVHQWDSGKALPYIFIEHMLKTGKYRQHYGCVGESLEIDFDAERAGFAMATFTFVGLAEDPAVAALTGTVTPAPTLDRPAQKLVNVTYNAVAGGDLMGGKFTHKRTLKRLRGADGTGIPYAVELDARSTLSGQIRTRFHDDAFYDDARNKTARALGIYLMKTAARGVKFDFGNARLSRLPVDVEGSGAIEYSPNFKAWQTSGAAAFSAKVLNSAATLVLP